MNQRPNSNSSFHGRFLELVHDRKCSEKAPPHRHCILSCNSYIPSTRSDRPWIHDLAGSAWSHMRCKRKHWANRLLACLFRSCWSLEDASNNPESLEPCLGAGFWIAFTVFFGPVASKRRLLATFATASAVCASARVLAPKSPIELPSSWPTCCKTSCARGDQKCNYTHITLELGICKSRHIYSKIKSDVARWESHCDSHYWE